MFVAQEIDGLLTYQDKKKRKTSEEKCTWEDRMPVFCRGRVHSVLSPSTVDVCG